MKNILLCLFAIGCFQAKSLASPNSSEKFESSLQIVEIPSESNKDKQSANGMSLENAYPFYNDNIKVDINPIESEPDLLTTHTYIEFGGGLVAMIILLSGIRLSIKR